MKEAEGMKNKVIADFAGHSAANFLLSAV